MSQSNMPTCLKSVDPTDLLEGFKLITGCTWQQSLNGVWNKIHNGDCFVSFYALPKLCKLESHVHSGEKRMKVFIPKCLFVMSVETKAKY